MLKGFATAVRLSCRPRIWLAEGTIESSRAWVGCSHWTTPFRPRSVRKYATDSRDPAEDEADLAERAEEEGITIDHLSVDVSPTEGGSGKPKLDRPTLPTSIKKLNRLLSHDRSIVIPDSDLIERFVKGRGPGGQAINKTNSSVSLTHIPTGIRIQSQPTRSREENRKIARRILMERLDLLRSHAAAAVAASAPVDRDKEEKTGGSRKEKEKELAGVWSREEIRWEKERRRKANRAKKSKKKSKRDGTSDAEGEGGVPDGKVHQ